MPDWSHDLVLNALQELDEPVGSFVRAFPGREGRATEVTGCATGLSTFLSGSWRVEVPTLRRSCLQPQLPESSLL